MLKKTFTYTDFNGVERTEDKFFNVSKAELMELELSEDGGLTSYINRITAAQSTPELIALFKKIILLSYGEKSADGTRFIKVDDNGVSLANRFAQTEMYSQLFMELATNDEAAAEFINKIVPADVAKELAAKAIESK